MQVERRMLSGRIDYRSGRSTTDLPWELCHVGKISHVHMSLRRAVRDTLTPSHFADSLQLEQQYNKQNHRWDGASYEGLFQRGGGVNGASKAQEVRNAHFQQPRNEAILSTSGAPEEYPFVSKECERKPTAHGDLLRIQEENCTSDDEVRMHPDSLSVNNLSF